MTMLLIFFYFYFLKWSRKAAAHELYFVSVAIRGNSLKKIFFSWQFQGESPHSRAAEYIACSH